MRPGEASCSRLLECLVVDVNKDWRMNVEISLLGSLEKEVPADTRFKRSHHAIRFFWGFLNRNKNLGWEAKGNRSPLPLFLGQHARCLLSDPLGGTYCKKVANSNCKSDGKASRASKVCAFGITGGEDGENQLECDEELHQKAVSDRDLSVHLRKRLSRLASTNLTAVCLGMETQLTGTSVTPSEPLAAAGVTRYNTPAPVMAPKHWAST